MELARIAADIVGIKAAYKINNEIRFDTFIPQARKLEILTPKRGRRDCNLTYSKAYLYLYRYLIHNKAITQKIEMLSGITWDFIHRVNADLPLLKKIIASLNEDRADFPEQLKCYNIKFDKLYDLLASYEYKVVDEARMANHMFGDYVLGNRKQGGTRRRTKKRGRRKRVKNRQTNSVF